jgi:hypothetical protein
MTLKPLSLRAANEYIIANHRHHGKVQGHKFSIGLEDKGGGVLLGCAVVGRPVARNLDDGYTAEVTRLCTDGTRNACSKLYSACARAAAAMGYLRIVTYILESETGDSLKATGWEKTVATGGGSWSRPSRGRIDKHPIVPKTRWERQLI